MKGARTAPQSSIRLSEDLKNWLKRRAVENCRSLNDEIIYRLSESRRTEAGSNEQSSA